MTSNQPSKISDRRRVSSPRVDSWGERLNEAVLALSEEAISSLTEALQTKALARGIWIENEGHKTPIELSLRPPLVDLAARGYLHHVAWQVRVGLRRSVRLVAERPDAARLMPLEDAERDWFDRYRRLGSQFGSQRLFCRLDALGSLEGAGWRERLKFVEANVIGIGGMSYSPPAEELMLGLVLPQLLRDNDDMEFDRNADPARLLLDELLHHARTSGPGKAPTIALVDDRSLYTLGGELGRLAPLYRHWGVDVIYADPRELALDSEGNVIADGRKVDVIYRFLELADLAAMEAAGDDLKAMRVGFDRNMVVPGVGGELEHKSVFELLTNPQFTEGFDPELRQVLMDHVLWTRLLEERRTTGPEGNLVDLVKYTRVRRNELVIKPNRSAGGEGVVIGVTVTDSEWDDALTRAMAQPGSHVVQSAIEPVAEMFPVWGAGKIELEPRYCAAGFFPGRTGLGIFGRFSASPVVNIQAGGGIAPYLVSVR